MRVALLTTDSREHYQDYGNPRPYFGSAPAALLEGFQELPHIEVHVVCCLHRPVSSPEKIAPNIWYLGLPISKWGWLRTGYAGCIRATRELLRKVRPDIVHGQGTERDCALTAVYSGFPNVLTIHGNMRQLAAVHRARPFSFLWITARLEALVLRRTHGVVCNSQHTLKLVRSVCKKVWLVPNPVQRVFFSELTDRPRSGFPVILNVGTIWPTKQQIELLDTLAVLWKRGLRFQVHFIGQIDKASDYGRRFLEKLETPELNGKAQYIGLLSREALRKQLDAATALIHVSREESFGLVVAEALARDLKVFVFKAGGLADILEEVDGAAVFEPQDWAGLMCALEKWISHGCPAAHTAEVVRRRYDPQAVAEKHVEIYREVLAAANK